MRSYTSPDSPLHCSRCLLQHAWCLCQQIELVETDFSIDIIRHWKERNRTSNTARLAQLILPRCSIYEWDIHDYHCGKLELPTISPDALLLFPPNGDQPIFSNEALAAHQAHPPTQLLVVDGTWRQTRKMVRRIPGLTALPRLSLPTRPNSAYRMRETPRPWAMSTLEAIAQAVALLESEDKAAPLFALFDEFVHRLQLQRDGGKERSPCS